MEWYQLAKTDKVWQILYHRRFVRNNPFNKTVIDTSNGKTYLQAFKSRFDDPEINDKVEVAWKGKFRLRADVTEVYQGFAWWIAEVVEKNPREMLYKISYPGWDDRWSEWVPRSRLRWKVESNTIEKLRLYDNVEIWCFGTTVPGAWLVTQIVDLQGDMVCVSNVLVSGDMWVRRDRVRLVKPSTTLSSKRLEDDTYSIQDRTVTSHGSHRSSHLYSQTSENDIGTTYHLSEGENLSGRSIRSDETSATVVDDNECCVIQ